MIVYGQFLLLEKHFNVKININLVKNYSVLCYLSKYKLKKYTKTVLCINFKTGIKKLFISMLKYRVLFFIATNYLCQKFRKRVNSSSLFRITILRKIIITKYYI